MDGKISVESSVWIVTAALPAPFPCRMPVAERERVYENSEHQGAGAYGVRG